MANTPVNDHKSHHSPADWRPPQQGQQGQSQDPNLEDKPDKSRDRVEVPNDPHIKTRCSAKPQVRKHSMLDHFKATTTLGSPKISQAHTGSSGLVERQMLQKYGYNQVPVLDVKVNTLEGCP